MEDGQTVQMKPRELLTLGRLSWQTVPPVLGCQRYF